jgi:hypothetical protein
MVVYDALASQQTSKRQLQTQQHCLHSLLITQGVNSWNLYSVRITHCNDTSKQYAATGASLL